MERLIPFFGERLLRFLLATPDGLELDELTERQAEVADRLKELVSDYEVEKAHEYSIHLQAALIEYIPDRGMSEGLSLRATAGGDVPAIEESSDSVARNMLLLARDFYPGALLPVMAQYGMLLASPRVGVYNHPQGRLFAENALNDPALSCLFPGAQKGIKDFSDLMKIQGYFIASTGHGGGLRLMDLAEQILRNANERMALAGSVGIAEHLVMTRKVLDDMRRLAMGETVDVPTAVALKNVKLPEGRTIRGGGAELRPVDGRDDLWLLPMDQASAALITSAPMKLLKVELVTEGGERPPGEFESFNQGFDETRQERQRRITAALFALLLASETAPQYAAWPGLMRVFDPLYHFAIAETQSMLPPPRPATVITESAVATIERWLDLIERYPSTLNVAIRRLLSAATARHDPLDGLIDAVLAWENMFSGKSETALRVCGALSILLMPSDFAARKALFAELKRIYNARSAIVHGGAKELDVETVGRMRDRAVEVGLDSMRRLNAIPELLGLDADTRGTDVLLGRLQQQCGDDSSA